MAGCEESSFNREKPSCSESWKPLFSPPHFSRLSMNSIQNPSEFPIGRLGRWLLGLWSVLLIAAFSVAAALEPDPRGYGTHQSLGLPPCTFQFLLGIPCPSCGMTTSLSHFVRGQFLASLRANVAGLLLGLCCAAQIPWCWISIRNGRLWKIRQPDLAVLWLLVILLFVAVLQWGLRLLY